MRWCGLVVCFVLGEGAVIGVQGQKPLTITGLQSLAFGIVLPGVPSIVSRTDPVKSGQFNIRGAKNAGIQLSFTLPGTMTGPLGATMPLSFGATDAGYSAPQSITIQVPFDPRAPFTTTLDKNGDAVVFLGGKASPSVTQRAGSYTGTVTLTVVYFP